MKKLLAALALQFTLPLALAIQAFPIELPSPLHEGAKAIDIRIDARSLYVKTSSNEIIRVDKLTLLNGGFAARAITFQQWAAIKKPALDLVLSDKQDWISTWQLGNQKILVKAAYCAEGLQERHALQISSRKVDTGLAGCMELFDPLHFDGKLWFRTNYPGEYGDSPGVGILIFDIAKQRRVAKITQDLAGGGSGLMRVDADLNGVWVVNDQAIHFFDKSLKRRALAYYSEQFDTNGKNWSVIQVSKERRGHNQFAVAARIIMTPQIRQTESQEAYVARLAQNRWVTADGITDYKKAVARLSSRVRSDFSIQYNAFERQHFPFLGSTQMTNQNDGKALKAASALLSCLYEKAGSPPHYPEYLVRNMAAAAQGLNWAEFQLYEPKCGKWALTQ